MGLSKEEKKRYSRHLLLNQVGEEGQLKLKEANVLVIGAGGLGCPVLQYLTAAGVGNIGIVDGDVIEASNLQRQVLFGMDDIGKSKVETAIKKLTSLNPLVNFKSFPFYLSSKNALQLFEPFDIVVDGTDNFSTRYLINDAAVLTNKPVVSASIFKFKGQLAVFNHQGSGTYRCLFPEAPEEGAVPNCSQVGVIGVLPGILGSLQANEIIKLILGIGTVLTNTLLTIDALTLEQQHFCFTKNPDIQISQLQHSYAPACFEEPKGIKHIAVSDLLTNRQAYQLLDVRTAQEYSQHNLGGINIPLNELKNRKAELPKGKPLVVCCASGKRSVLAIQILTEMPTQREIFNLAGGLNST